MVAKVRRRSAAGPTIKKRADTTVHHQKKKIKLDAKKRLFASFFKDLAKGTRVVLCGP